MPIFKFSYVSVIRGHKYKRLKIFASVQVDHHKCEKHICDNTDIVQKVI